MAVWLTMMTRGSARNSVGKWAISGTIAFCLVGLVGGCDWLDSGPSAIRPVRPGADRSIGPTERLPQPRAAQQYDAAVGRQEAGRGAEIGDTVPAAGGQQAQKEKEAKALADVKAEWERERAADPFAASASPPSRGSTIQ